MVDLRGGAHDRYTTVDPFVTAPTSLYRYDPRLSPAQRRPYEYDSQVELICPLDAQTVLRGTNRIRPVNQIVRHGRIADRGAVARINNTISQFAYSLALAKDRSSDNVIALHATRCPTISIDVVEKPKDLKIIWRHRFGPRPKLSPYIDTPAKAERLEAQMAVAKAAASGDGKGGAGT